MTNLDPQNCFKLPFKVMSKDKGVDQSKVNLDKKDKVRQVRLDTAACRSVQNERSILDRRFEGHCRRWVRL